MIINPIYNEYLTLINIYLVFFSYFNTFNQFVSRDANNQNPLQSQNISSAPQSAEDIYRASQETFTFGLSNNQALQTAFNSNPVSTQANPESLF
jgi:hypothetical protein